MLRLWGTEGGYLGNSFCHWKVFLQDKYLREGGRSSTRCTCRWRESQWVEGTRYARPQSEKMQAKHPAFSSGGQIFYIIWLGNEVFANKVSRKAIRVVCKERHNLAFMQCRCQERREARGLLLRSPVKQLQPGLVRCSLNPRATHHCLKNNPFNHYKGVPKIRRSGLLSQQQSPSGPPRCRKSSGNWRREIWFFGTTAW